MFGENVACGVLCSTCYVLFEQFSFPTHITGSLFSMSQHEIGEKKAFNSKLVLAMSKDLQLLAVQIFILLSPAGERKQSREDSGWKTTQCASRQERFYLLKHRLS